MKMKLGTIAVVSSAFLFTALNLMPAHAGPGTWNRGPVNLLAKLPPGSTGPEGITVGSDGNLYVTTFGFNASGEVGGLGQLYVFMPNGTLLSQVPVQNSTSHLLGTAFHPTSNILLVIDFGNSKVLSVDPNTGSSSDFMTLPAGGDHGLNALTFDQNGNVYVSDSIDGTIWMTGPNGGVATAWVTDPLLKTTGVPPFGANGLDFNSAGNALFVSNTGNDTIVKIPVVGGNAGTPEIFTNSVNGPDGLVVDACDYIWVAANQADEIVVVDPTGKVVAKLGDFGGVDKHKVPIGFLFPASLVFSGNFLYVTNLALDLRLIGLPGLNTVDSQWASMVETYTISRIKPKIKPIGHAPPLKLKHCLDFD